MKKVVICIIFSLLLVNVHNVSAGKCYAKSECFSVSEPALISKACFLFRHATNVPLRTQSEMIIVRPEELHSDPLQAEFYRLILDKKILAIKKNTRFYNCKYDLKVVADDFKMNGNTAGTGRILGYEYPEFNCAGRVSKFVQVRLQNMSQCRWVAVETIKCDD